MIADILPPQVAVAEEFGDLPDVRLFPDEEAVIANAVDKRRREFATARACARTALAKLGVPAAPIVPGSRGAPQWPPGVVGSITHCAGYRASAVALGRDVVTIGSARLLVDGPVVNGEMLTGLDGRWLVSNGLLATAIVILRRGEGAG